MEPIAALTGPLALRTVRGLPMVARPTDAVLRPKRYDVVTGGVGVIAGGALVSIMAGASPVIAWVVLATSFGGLVWRMRRRMRQLTEAVGLLNQGRSDEAMAAFREIARTSSGGIRAVALHNYGVCLMRRGDVVDALGIFCEIAAKKATRTAAAANIRAALPFTIALCFAQLGDVPAAQQWLTEAKRKKSPAHIRNDLIVDAMILLRSHKDAAAVELFAKHWREIEAMSHGRSLREWRVRRAFALQNTGATSADVEEMLAGTRPFERGDYDHLGAHWPELQVFLAEHRLV
jgi:hypothetical protein